MIYDCFYLNNEVDMLEMRLNILDEYVDKFVIVEATETFSGKPKELTYLKNKDLFKKWEHKIIYHVVDNYPKDLELYKLALSSPNTGDKEHYWVREFYQKESLQKALVGLNDSDIVFISDLDEVWNPKIEFTPEEGEVIKPKQLPYLYFLDQRTDEDWHGWSGTICALYKTIKEGVINHLRTDSMTDYTIIHNGGWHFNSIGGRKIKQSSFAHPVYEYETEWSRREVNLRKDDTSLPEYLLNNKDKYKKFFL